MWNGVSSLLVRHQLIHHLSRPKLLHSNLVSCGLICVEDRFDQLFCVDYLRLTIAHDHYMLVVFVELQQLLRVLCCQILLLQEAPSPDQNLAT